MAEATQLKSRHLTMMGLGSAVGAGLFLGVGLGTKVFVLGFARRNPGLGTLPTATVTEGVS